MPNDPITLQEMPGVRARTYQDLVRYLMNRAGQAVAPAGMSLSDVLANAGDVAGFGHRANMGLVNTGTEDRPLWIPRPGAEFDPSGSAFVKTPVAPTITPIEERIATMGKMRDANARNIGLSRRNFMKAVPGGALAAKALLSGGETGIKNQTSKILNEVAAQGTATAAPPLGAAPVRIYERVGNKFILIKEAHPGDYGRDADHLGDWPLPSEINRTVHGVHSPVDWKKVEAETGVRPKQAIRTVEPGVGHPEHRLLAEPGRVLQPNIHPETGQHMPGTPEYMNDVNDPYHARLLEAQEIFNALPDRLQARLKDANIHGTPPPNMMPTEKEAWKIFDRGRPITTNTYIIEKPIRVRYHEKGLQDLEYRLEKGEITEQQYEAEIDSRLAHPEVYKLPLETNKDLLHDAEEADSFNLRSKGSSPGLPHRWPRLIGSGDTMQEANDKALSFLRDIGADKSKLKFSGGSSIKKIELPNGDVIEIRERPSLRLHSTFPVSPNSYIVEKPIRVRYIEQGRHNLNRLEQEGELADVQDFDKYEESIHPEVWKLPMEHRGNIVHEAGEVLYDDAAGNAPRLIGSGDTYNEAHSKADSFLRDIGIEPGTINWSGAKVRRATLPNGDIIEIRERPSLRPGKAGYRNKKK